MHVKITDQHNGHSVEVCIHRDSGSARVLSWCCPEHLDMVIQIIKATNVDSITLVSPKGSNQHQTLFEAGWKLSNSVEFTKGLNNGT